MYIIHASIEPNAAVASIVVLDSEATRNRVALL